MISGLAKAGTKAGTTGRMHLGATPSQRRIPRLCRRGMETQNSLMTMCLMSSCTRCSNPGGRCFLYPRLTYGLTDRFAVDGGLEQFLEYLKTKIGIRRPQVEGIAFKKVHLRNQTCEGESTTSWINRSDEAPTDMRKKLASAPGAQNQR